MAESTQDVISTLNDLIETCKDGEQGFRDAADGVSRPDLKSFFSECGRQRTQFASELQRSVSRLGGSPETSGSVSGSLHRGWINLKSSLTGKDDHAILVECERGEDAAVKNYQEALEKDVPSDVMSMIDRQYRAILEVHQRIRAMRDASAGETTRGTGTEEYTERRTY